MSSNCIIAYFHLRKHSHILLTFIQLSPSTSPLEFVMARGFSHPYISSLVWFLVSTFGRKMRQCLTSCSKPRSLIVPINSSESVPTITNSVRHIGSLPLSCRNSGCGVLGCMSAGWFCLLVPWPHSTRRIYF